jgi:hypothetical protein
MDGSNFLGPTEPNQISCQISEWNYQPTKSSFEKLSVALAHIKRELFCSHSSSSRQFLSLRIMQPRLQRERERERERETERRSWELQKRTMEREKERQVDIPW